MAGTTCNEPLAALQFDNSFVRTLPGDRSRDRTVRAIASACFASIEPVPVRAPKLVACSAEVLELLELTPARVSSEPFAAALAGNALLPGMEPYAAGYGGHQFGAWVGQLGDGRAITLGELVTSSGARLELQLKGAGHTPYSRAGDGRAVLRSSIREFLASEALFHLGVPTTRALSLSTTGEGVLRDMLYDGRPRHEPGAIVCRVAPSFLRFGSFELLAARDEQPLLAQLLEFANASYFPELAGAATGVERHVALFHEVCRRTAVMIASWMRVGFVHGVMNTDNMSLLGLTLDYGPFGFLDHYDPGFTPNTTDVSGRYRYAAQPGVGKWNLFKLAESLFPLVRSVQPLLTGLAQYDATLAAALRRMRADKLGLTATAGELDGDPESTHALYEELMVILSLIETDFTIFFRALADLPIEQACVPQLLLATVSPAYYEDPSEEARARTIAWLRRYADRVRRDARPPAERRAQMLSANPRYVLRNYQAQQVIDAAERGDYAPLEELLGVLRHPYDDQPGREPFAARRPDWARDRAGCSQLSCSS